LLVVVAVVVQERLVQMVVVAVLVGFVTFQDIQL